MCVCVCMCMSVGLNTECLIPFTDQGLKVQILWSRMRKSDVEVDKEKDGQ